MQHRNQLLRVDALTVRFVVVFVTVTVTAIGTDIVTDLGTGTETEKTEIEIEIGRKKKIRIGTETWKEKEKKGSALVAPDVEHQYNLPDGYKYDLQGEGLSIPETDSGPNLMDFDIPGFANISISKPKE